MTSPLHLVGDPAEVAEARRGARDVEAARVADRMTGVAALQGGELVGVGLDGVGEAEQQAAPLGGGQRPPAGEGVVGGVHRPVDVGGTGLGDLGDHRAVVRIDDLDRRPVDPVDELVADEQPGLHGRTRLRFRSRRDIAVPCRWRSARGDPARRSPTPIPPQNKPGQ